MAVPDKSAMKVMVELFKKEMTPIWPNLIKKEYPLYYSTIQKERKAGTFLSLLLATDLIGAAKTGIDRHRDSLERQALPFAGRHKCWKPDEPQP